MTAVRKPPRDVRPPGAPALDAARSPATELSPGRALVLPSALALALLAFAPLTRQNPALVRTFLAAGGALLLWSAALYMSARRANRTLTLADRAAQTTLAASMRAGNGAALLGLARADRLRVPAIHPRAADLRLRVRLPIDVVSAEDACGRIRPFPDHLQHQSVPLVPAGVVLLAVRDDRAGLRRQGVHPLEQGRALGTHLQSVLLPAGRASLALLLTGTSDITLGNIIANTQFDAPNIYLVIFLVALPGQLLFGVARMTLAAVVTMYVVSLLYFAATGTYLFYDAHIPVPVFLGMHLLFTDPSTSPRTELGRILFGVLYALLTRGVLRPSHGPSGADVLRQAAPGPAS